MADDPSQAPAQPSVTPVPEMPSSLADSAADSVTSTPVTETVTETHVEPVAPAPSVRDMIAEQTGIDASQWTSDDDALSYVRSMAQAMPRLTGLAQVGERAMQGQLPPGVEPPAAAAQPQQPQVDPLQAHFKEKWPVPEYDPQWDKMIDSGMVTYNNASGQYEPAVEFLPPQHVAGLNQWMQFKRDSADKLVREFPQVATEVLGPWIEKQIDERVNNIIGSQQTQSQLQQFVQANSNILFEQNDQGGFQIDPVSGQPLPSPVGQRFGEWMAHLEQQGMTGMPAAELALRATAADLMQTQMAAGQPRAGNGQPAAASQQPAAQSPQAPGDQPFMEAALQRAVVQPSASGGSPGQAPAVPEVRSLTNLRGFLERNARATGMLPQLTPD